MGGTLTVFVVLAGLYFLDGSRAALMVLLVASALLALGFLATALRRARACGDLNASTCLTLSIGALLSLPIALAVLSGQLVRELDAARELVPINPSWYDPAAYSALGLVIAVALALFLRSLALDGREVKVNPAGLLAILLWAVAQLASGLHGGKLISLSGIALLVALVAATVLPRGRGAAIGVGIFGVALAAASGLFAVVSWGDATVPCRHECVLGDALTGVLPNENLLGTTLLATLPFAYLGFRGQTRTLLVLYLAAMAFTTGSRGAMLIAVVVVAALFVVRPSLDAERPAPRRTALAGIMLAIALLASAWIVLQDWGSAESLTDRSGLWRVATGYINDSPAFGYGPYRWEMLYTEGGEIPQAAQHSTHNQWIDVLFAAGWVGVATLIAMMIAMIATAGYARPAVLLALATIFLIGVTERAWSVGSADFASFALIALILLGPTRAPERADTTAAAPFRARREPVPAT